MKLGEGVGHSQAEQLNKATELLTEWRNNPGVYSDRYRPEVEDIAISVLGHMPRLTEDPVIFKRTVGVYGAIIEVAPIMMNLFSRDESVVSLNIQQTGGKSAQSLTRLSCPFTVGPAERCLVVAFSHPSVGYAGTHRLFAPLDELIKRYTRYMEDEALEQELTAEAQEKVSAQAVDHAIDSTSRALAEFRKLARADILPADTRLIAHGLSQLRHCPDVLEAVGKAIETTARKVGITLPVEQPFFINKLGEKGFVGIGGPKNRNFRIPRFVAQKDYR